jgi:hypothetical protein
MDFLLAKASNFRKMLVDLGGDSEILQSFREEDLVPLIKSHLLPLYFTGTLGAAVSKVVEAYPGADSEKVRRYLECFCECVLKDHVG